MIYFHFYLLNNSWGITVNLVTSYEIYHNYFNTRFTLYSGIFPSEGKNWCNLHSVKKNQQNDVIMTSNSVNMSIKVMALRCWKKWVHYSVLFWCPYHEQFWSYRRVDLTRVSKRAERAFWAAERATKLREADLSHLNEFKGFICASRQK